MQDLQDLLAKARSLGEALAAQPTVRAHFEAQRHLQVDEAARKLAAEYQAQLDHIRRLEEERKPIEVADKHKLKDLETQLAGNDVLKNLMRTQADYVALMNQVNRAMDAPLNALLQSELAE